MKTNFFGERICDKKCPLWVDDGEDGFCDVRLDFNGRIGVKDGIIQYGKLCELPNNVLIIKRTELMTYEDSTPHNPSLLVNILKDEGFSILEIGEIMDHSLEWVLQHLIGED